MGMSEQLHYRRHDVFRRDASGEVVIYRCFEVLPRGGYVVQSADRVRLPLERSVMEHHERQLLELFCEMEPRMRGELFPTAEEAIASFDKAFSDIDEGNEL